MIENNLALVSYDQIFINLDHIYLSVKSNVASTSVYVENGVIPFVKIMVLVMLGEEDGDCSHWCRNVVILSIENVMSRMCCSIPINEKCLEVIAVPKTLHRKVWGLVTE